MTWQVIKLHLKGALRSWTIHFNVWIAAVWAALPTLQEWFPQLQNYLPAKGYQYAMGLIILGNLILRFKTTQSLATKVPTQ
jgi:hypothetical protein